VNASPTPRAGASRPPIVLGCALLLVVGVLLAGCGSGSGADTITVGNENSADNALAATGGTERTATTPTSGPLSEEPKVTPPSGAAPTTLEKKDLIVGSGAEAQSGQTITVNYVGVLFKGGKEFDASWKRHEPFTFKLGAGQVIAGWDQGIVGMKIGGRRELVIPANLAYGAKRSGSTIPPNAPLVFVVDLLGT
jgi:peptidylprolyl isomerase